MPKKKVSEEPIPSNEPTTIRPIQHLTLNNLNMIMFYIRKKNIPTEYLVAIEERSREILNEIKAL